MGLKKYFLDGATYGADDVNAVFASLVSQGVALSGTDSLKSELLSAVSEVIESGGVNASGMGGMRVTQTDGSYFVSEGICFFYDGSMLSVEGEPYAIAPESGKKSYVYAEHSATKNTMEIVVSNSPGGEGTVALALIDEDGAITDMRSFATSNIASLTSNAMLETALKITCPAGESSGYTYAEATYNVGYAGFNYIRTYYDNEYHFTPLDTGGLFWESGSHSAWVTKNGSQLVVKTGTWGEKQGTTTNVNILLL